MGQPVLSSVERQALQLKPDEQLALMEKLAHNLRSEGKSNAPRDLRGIYRGKLPSDVDLDAMLREIRLEWMKETDEL